MEGYNLLISKEYYNIIMYLFKHMKKFISFLKEKIKINVK